MFNCSLKKVALIIYDTQRLKPKVTEINSAPPHLNFIQNSKVMGKKNIHSDGGNPCKKVKRDVPIYVYVTAREQFVLKEKASKTGLTLSRYLREMGINAQVKMRLSEEDRNKLNGLIGMSNNLNQLSNLAQEQGLLKISFLLVDLRDKIDGLLNHIESD